MKKIKIWWKQTVTISVFLGLITAYFTFSAKAQWYKKQIAESFPSLTILSIHFNFVSAILVLFVFFIYRLPVDF